MHLVERRAAADAAATDELVLPFESRNRSRLRTRLASGEECGLFLERGTVLRGGDKLLTNEGRVIAVRAASEALMEARCADARQLARVAYHLGNRHVAVEIVGDCVRFGNDHVLGEMVRGLGARVVEISAPFEPEGGAYASHGSHASQGDASTTGHHHVYAPQGHSADGEGRGARIHDGFKAP